jgi:hypothetical protein
MRGHRAGLGLLVLLAGLACAPPRSDIAGPGIRPGLALTTAVSTVDTAATAAAVLGLSLDEGASGQAVDEAFAR